jgi:hypothetical protein
MIVVANYCSLLSFDSRPLPCLHMQCQELLDSCPGFQPFRTLLNRVQEHQFQLTSLHLTLLAYSRLLASIRTSIRKKSSVLLLYLLLCLLLSQLLLRCNTVIPLYLPRPRELLLSSTDNSYSSTGSFARSITSSSQICLVHTVASSCYLDILNRSALKPRNIIILQRFYTSQYARGLEETDTR